MSDEIPIPNAPLTPEELSFVAKLTDSDLGVIDNTILSCAKPRRQKVAIGVTRAMEKLVETYPECPYAFLAERIRQLADRGLLESQGNLSYMRFSEVGLPPMS